MTHTTVNTISYRDHKALCGLVLAAFPALKWRHNGLGLLQSYLLEGERDELRVHIWHKSLKRDGIEESGLLHDHRFDLTSHVLIGEILQREFELTASPTGAWRTHTVVHAREALKKHAINDGDVSEQPYRFDVESDDTDIVAGRSYWFPRGVFHGTFVKSDIAVTLVRKSNQVDYPARILAPHDKPVVHAFADPLPPSAWEHPLRLAAEALRGVFVQ